VESIVDHVTNVSTQGIGWLDKMPAPFGMAQSNR
jgi:hypothetical protein